MRFADGGTRVVVTRSGVEVHGIGTMVRAAHRIALPVISSWLGRLALASIVIAGGVSLVVSDGPVVSHRPWVDAAIGLLLGYLLSACQEVAHAVTLTHYGYPPRRVSGRFYRGALCLFVGGAEDVELPRRARIIVLLAGLALFLVAGAALLLVAHVSTAVLLTSRLVSGLHPAVARRAQERAADMPPNVPATCAAA